MTYLKSSSTLKPLDTISTSKYSLQTHFFFLQILTWKYSFYFTLLSLPLGLPCLFWLYCLLLRALPPMQDFVSLPIIINIIFIFISSVFLDGSRPPLFLFYSFLLSFPCRTLYLPNFILSFISCSLCLLNWTSPFLCSDLLPFL